MCTSARSLRDQAADVVQARLALERLEEQRQRFEERSVAEVVEPAGAARGLGDDLVDGEGVLFGVLVAHAAFSPGVARRTARRRRRTYGDAGGMRT